MKILKKLSFAACLLVLGIMLTGCGGQSKQEKMLESAIEIDLDDIVDEQIDNEARAVKKYAGKAVKVTATVRTIESEYCKMSEGTYNGLPLNSFYVYLSKDVLADLEREQTITVVGIMDDKLQRIEDAFIVE